MLDARIDEQMFRTPLPPARRKTTATFPAVGDHVRATLRRDQQSWQGSERVVTPAGSVREGVVVDVEAEGFFTLETAAGMPVKLYLNDSALHIEVTSRIRRA